jgi:galactonate dehydratase
VPVWRLLGGACRDHLRTYTHLGLGDMTSVYESFGGAVAERAQRVAEAGYDAVKVVNIPYSHYTAPARAVDGVARAMEALRGAVGDAAEIMVDFHGRPASVAAARDYIAACAPARPLFVEEPVPPEDLAGMAHLTATSPVTIAGGERLVGRREFVPALAARAFHIAQPDIAHVGGLGEARKVAAMAESAGIGLAPHNPLGPVAGIAALHFGIATPNVIIQEEMSGAVPWYAEVVEWPITPRPGRWDRPERPGLGLEIDERVVAAHPFEPEIQHARNAVLADGTVVDW